MNPGRFFMPGYMGMPNSSMISPIMRMANSSMASPMMRMASSAPRSMGLFSRITNGIRSFNWSGLLSGANKTLNVVNQAIPLVRQAGPMISNMRNMMRIAKAFGSETTTTKSSGKNENNSNQISNNTNNVNNTNSQNNSFSDRQELSIEDNTDAPTFFV